MRLAKREKRALLEDDEKKRGNVGLVGLGLTGLIILLGN